MRAFLHPALPFFIKVCYSTIISSNPNKFAWYYMILVLLLYAAFGLSFTIGKLLITYSEPFFAVGARMTIGGILLLGYMRFYKKEKFVIYRKNIKYYVQVTLLNIFLPYTLRLWAFKQHVSTVKASLLFNLSPFFTAFFAYIILRERLSIIKALGLMIGFVGMTPLLMYESPQEIVSGGFAFLSYAELAIIAAVAALSYSLILLQKLAKHKGSPAYFITGISMFFGGILSFVCSIIYETNFISLISNYVASIVGMSTLQLSITQLWNDLYIPVLTGSEWYFVYTLIFQVLLSNVICQNLRVELLKRYSSTFMSFASFLGPLFTGIYGWFIFNESITWHFFASLAIVLSGLAIYHYDDNMQQSPPRDTLSDSNA